MTRSFLRGHALFAILFLLVGLSLPFGIREGNDWGGDFAVYIQQAKNLAEHRPFFESSYVPTPESLAHQPAIYPPLSSLLLAPVYAARGLDYRAMKLLLAFVFWLSLPFYYLLGLRRGIKPTAMAIAMLLFVLSPMVVGLEQNIGSDFVFVFVSALALLGIDEIYRRGWDVRRPLLSGLGAAVLLFVCYLTRATGLAVVGGFAAYEALRSRRIRKFNIAAAVLLAASLLIYTRFFFDAQDQYGSQFVLQPAVWVQNAIAYMQTPAVIWAGAPSIIRYPLAVFTLGFGITGWVRRMRRPEPIEFYICLWQTVLLFYSVSDRRYLLMAIPFLLMYTAEGIEFLREEIARMRPAWNNTVWTALVLFTVGVIAASAANLRVVETGPIREGATQPSFAELCTFLRLNTPHDGVILSWNPRVIALYTQKKSALYPQSVTPQDFEGAIPVKAHRQLVYHRQDLDRQLLTPYLTYAAPRLVKRFENADFTVFELPGTRPLP